MKFYDREQEITLLKKIRQQSASTSCMTVLIGRRRVGKTSLILHALEGGENFIYLFVSRTNEGVLCGDFKKAIEQHSDIRVIGNPLTMRDLMEQLFQRACLTPLTIVLDEFQEFEYVNASFYSDLQRLWDIYHDRAHLNLIICGSVYSMMKHIFEDSKMPLFGRMTSKMMLRPFSTDTLKQILLDHNPDYTPDDLLCLYAVTGGVPMYVSLLMDSGATTKERMLDEICSPSSRFLNEAPDMLIGEFGRHYSNYFGILQLVAGGMTTQKEIDSIIGKNTGAYLQTLENDYALIERNLPYGSKPGTRNIKWRISDNLLAFWFRFLSPNKRLIETGDLRTLRDIIEEGYPQFSGLVLEKYFRQKYAEQYRITEVSSWWDRTGENEIDLIAVNSLDKKVTVAEVKRNVKKINMAYLEEKVSHLAPLFPKYDIEVKGLSMQDM